MVRKPSVLLAFAICFNCSTSYAEPRKFDLQTAQSFDQVYEMMSKLDGRMSRLEQTDRLRIVAEEAAKNPKLIELAQYVANTIKQQKRPDQQEAFLLALSEMSCRVLQDGCALKTRLEDHESRLRELEREKDHPNEPTPPNPPPVPHVPPTWQVPVWRGSIDAIVLPRELCPNAVLLAQCVDKDFGDVTYHGNVFLNCHGKYVFVKHVKTAPHPMLLAKPVTP